MYLLFPGRHHLMTQFQHQYLQHILKEGWKNVKDADGHTLEGMTAPTALLFAVTSSNHSNTRRNPVPFHLRAILLEDFSDDLPIDSFIYGIDDVGTMPDFAAYTLKRIQHDSEGNHKLSPENTLVICSTPVMKLYQALGYRILTAELNSDTQRLLSPQPWDIVSAIANGDEEMAYKHMHESSVKIWLRYKLEAKVKTLFRDHIIGDDGDLTQTRDYNTYVRQMDEIADLKYKDTADYIRTGRIGDIGCAVGSWIKLACEDSRLHESDFYGIEVSRHLYEVCLQRKANGDFKNPFVFFAQKNAVTSLCFEAGSMNTIFTSSLTHEIESYGNRADLLAFIRNRFEELKPGGIWINRDVVGPEDKARIILMKLNKQDGKNEHWDKIIEDPQELAAHLNALSTFSKFLRFAQDFRKKEGDGIQFEITQVGYEDYVKLSYEHATEFLTKKDYTDNWQSEMHERFAFWSFSDWKHAAEEAGFHVVESSHTLCNPWIVENRWKGKATLCVNQQGRFQEVPYPVTTMFLLLEKR